MVRARLITDAECHWLAGLTDGEGCFSFYVRRRKNPGCYSFDFSFKIAMRADDAPTLREAARILGATGSYYVAKRPAGSNGKPLAAYHVQKKSEIAKVIAFFRQHSLRSKKARDFSVWATAFEFYCEVICALPIKHVRFARLDRPSKSSRRPLAGTPKSKLRRTPPEIVATMERFADAIKQGREYR